MMQRVDVEEFRKQINSLSQKDLEKIRLADQLKTNAEYAKFIDGYRKNVCYLCGKPFKTISKNNPCIHWLLRQCKFKKKDLSLLFGTFGYTQFAAFTRWVANQEKYINSINNLIVERPKRKLFQYTVKWNNIEWSFDCSNNDYTGHTGKHSNYPHFHFQMRIDNRPFINFSDFHIPFTEEDLFHIDLTLNASDIFHQSFGEGGLGIQDAMEFDPDYIINETEHTENDDIANYRLQTMILPNDGNALDFELLQKMINECNETGSTLASLSHKYFGEEQNVKTIISPASNVPEIAKRTERKRR